MTTKYGTPQVPKCGVSKQKPVLNFHSYCRLFCLMKHNRDTREEVDFCTREVAVCILQMLWSLMLHAIVNKILKTVVIYSVVYIEQYRKLVQHSNWNNTRLPNWALNRIQVRKNIYWGLIFGSGDCTCLKPHAENCLETCAHVPQCSWTSLIQTWKG